ncbi:MAG: hypothetical protein D6732_27810 [Methanobacteriota archaeon]|nr:MAG: hypothetical protein D6732_27810 [Euryarchaeota archaeon]
MGSKYFGEGIVISLGCISVWGRISIITAENTGYETVFHQSAGQRGIEMPRCYGKPIKNGLNSAQ